MRFNCKVKKFLIVFRYFCHFYASYRRSWIFFESKFVKTMKRLTYSPITNPHF